MAIDTTVGGADANAYADSDYYKAYWAGRPQSDDALGWSDDEIDAGIMWATLVLDSSMPWTGSAADDVQALCWPRLGMYTRNGYAIATTALPKALKDSCCQQAGDGLAAERTADDDAQRQGLTSLSVGPISLAFSDRAALADPRQMDLALRRLGPEFDWTRFVSDAARMLLVPTWYTRASLGRAVVFEAHR